MGSLSVISSYVELSDAFNVFLSGDLTNFKLKCCETSSWCSSTRSAKTVGDSLNLYLIENLGFLLAFFDLANSSEKVGTLPRNVLTLAIRVSLLQLFQRALSNLNFWCSFENLKLKIRA